MPSVIRYRPALRAVVVTAGGSSGSSVPFCRIWSQVCRRRRLQHVIREEKPAVARHHHHLHLVGKPLGDNLLNQERAYFKAAASVFMRCRIGGRCDPDAIGFGIRHQLAFFQIRAAVSLSQHTRRVRTNSALAQFAFQVLDRFRSPVALEVFFQPTQRNAYHVTVMQLVAEVALT